MGRSRCSVKEGMKRGAWTAAEDKILKDYIKANGEGKWRNLPKKAGLKRCGKSCRHRWTNYLRPDIKRGNITDDEVDLIIRLHNLLGNRWSLIAGRLPGRTDNEIKNYWNTNIHKTMNGQLPSSTSNRKPPNPSKENHNHMTKQSVIPSSSTMSCSTLVCTKASGCTRAFTTEESHKAQPLHDIMVAPEKQELVTPIASDGYNSSNFTMDFEMDEKLIFDFLNSENSTLFSFEDGMKCNGNPNTDDMSCWTPCPNQNGLFSGEIFVEDFDIEPMTFNIHKTMNGQLPSSTSNHKPPNPSKDNHNHMTKQSVIPSPSTISCSTLVCTKASGCTRAFTTEESHKAQPLALHDIMVAPEKQELVTPIASYGYNSSNFTMDFEMDEKLISDFLNSENSTLFSFEDGVKCNGNPNTNDMRCWTRCPNQNALFSGEIFVEDFDIEPMTFNILDTKMDWLKKQ